LVERQQPPQDFFVAGRFRDEVISAVGSPHGPVERIMRVRQPRRPGIAYRTDGVSCDCEAAMLGGDPVCLHRAAYWHARGMLELDPEPEPPASAAPVICFRCRGAEAGCPLCKGAGVASLSAQAAALRAAA
jgi:hypothetical protein